MRDRRRLGMSRSGRSLRSHVDSGEQASDLVFTARETRALVHARRNRSRSEEGFARLQIIPALSDDAAEDAWSGEIGSSE